MTEEDIMLIDRGTRQTDAMAGDEVTARRVPGVGESRRTGRGGESGLAVRGHGHAPGGGASHGRAPILQVSFECCS